VLVVLGLCREILGEKWSAGWEIYSADCKSLCPGWDIHCCDFKCCKLWWVCFVVTNFRIYYYGCSSVRWPMSFCSMYCVDLHAPFVGRLKMSFVDECNINPMFCKEFGQEILVIEHSIFIPKLNF
jgi:hypothetical protein